MNSIEQGISESTILPFPSDNEVLQPNENEITSSSHICKQPVPTGLFPNIATQSIKRPVNAIPQEILPQNSSPIKIEPIEFVNSQNDDPLGDRTSITGKNTSLSTQSNWPCDKGFEFNFVDLLTNDSDLSGWTGLVSFDSLQSLMKYIPNGESIAASYGMSLRNLIVMVLVRTKMNIPFEQMTVLFPMNATLLAKCFSEFLPILEATTSISIPPIARSQANTNDTVLILERPVISTIGKIRKITTRKNSIRVNPAGKITAVKSTSVPSAAQMIPPQQDSERISSENVTSTNLTFRDSMLINVGVKESGILPSLRSTASSSIAFASRKTEECKKTIDIIKSYRILNEKVAPSMSLYMDIIVRLVCGILNFNNTTSFSDTILQW